MIGRLVILNHKVKEKKSILSQSLSKLAHLIPLKVSILIMILDVVKAEKIGLHFVELISKAKTIKKFSITILLIKTTKAMPNKSLKKTKY